jgi:uncharacterized membrane protein
MISNFIPLVGGLINGYLRGGGLKTMFPEKDGSEWKLNGLWLSVPFFTITALCIFIVNGLDWKILSGTVAMWAGMSFGWGAYVGVLNGSVKPHPEQKWIDWMIKPLEKHPRLWGVIGVSIRGLVIGLLLSLATLSWPFIPLSLSMGIVYLIGMNAPFKATRWLNHWTLSEILYGAVLYLGFIL